MANTPYLARFMVKDVLLSLKLAAIMQFNCGGTVSAAPIDEESLTVCEF